MAKGTINLPEGFVLDKPTLPEGFVLDQQRATFDPEGSGYDYETAKKYGIKPDETGHWQSRVPQTGQLLKGRGHETFYKTLKGEEDAGYSISKGKDGRYYSHKPNLPEGFVLDQTHTNETLGNTDKPLPQTKIIGDTAYPGYSQRQLNLAKQAMGSSIGAEPVTELEASPQARAIYDRRNAMSDDQRWLDDNNYPQEFLPLLKPVEETRGVSMIAESRPGRGGLRNLTKQETFKANIKKLPANDPLRFKAGRIMDLQKKATKLYNESLIKEGKKLPPHKYKGLWSEIKFQGDEALKAGIGMSGRLQSGLVGTAAQYSEFAPWDRQALEDYAEKVYQRSQAKALQPRETEGISKVGQFVGTSVAQAFPYMAMSTAAGLTFGPAGSFAVGFSVEGEEAKRKVIELGGSEEDGDMAKLIVGTLNGAIETLQVSNVINFAKEGKGSVKAIIAAARKRSWDKVKELGKELTYETLELALRESLEEAMQEQTQLAVETGTDPESVSLFEQITRTGKSALGGFVVGPILGGAGRMFSGGDGGADSVKPPGPRFDPAIDNLPTDQAQFDKDIAAMDAEQEQHRQSIQDELARTDPVAKLSPKDQARQDTRKKALMELPDEELEAKLRKTKTTSPFFREIYDVIVRRKEETPADDTTEIQQSYSNVTEAVEKPPEPKSVEELVAKGKQNKAEEIAKRAEGFQTGGPIVTPAKPDKSSPLKAMSEQELKDTIDDTTDPEMQRLAQVELQGRPKPAVAPTEKQAFFHGTSVEGAEKIKAEGFKFSKQENEVSITKKRDVAEFHGKKATGRGRKGVVLSIALSEDAKIFSTKDIPVKYQEGYVSQTMLDVYARTHGFDGIDLAQLEEDGIIRVAKGKEGEVVIFHPEVLAEYPDLAKPAEKGKVVRAEAETQIKPLQDKGYNIKLVGSIETKGESANDIDVLLSLPKYPASEKVFKEFEADLKKEGWNLTSSGEKEEFGIFNNYEKEVDGRLVGLDVFTEEGIQPPQAKPAQKGAQDVQERKAPTEVARPETKRGTTLSMGLDTGLDKYIARNVRPAFITAYNALKTVGKIVGVIPKWSAAKFIQPSLEIERKSNDAYVAVMRAVHTAQDAAKLDFKNMPLESLDMNIEQARKFFAKFTKEENHDFIVAFAGQPGTPNAALLQKEAFDRLPDELKTNKVIAAIREIANKNYEYLKRVVGPQVHFIPDYFYGVFESKRDVDKFWAHWTSTDKFTKKKIIPSVADAIMYSELAERETKLRQDNYIDNLRAEYLGIARLDAMKQLKKELMAIGSAGTKKAKRRVKRRKGKKNRTKIQRRADNLAGVYHSANEALRVQEIEYKMFGGKVLTEENKALLAELKTLVAEEEAARGKPIEPPPVDEPLDSLREKSEAEDEVNTIHPENADFFITEDPEMVQPGWVGVADPVFRAAYLRPDLARLIDNLTATNKITQDKVLNAVRQANNFTRSLTFFLSAFHFKTVTLAAIADSGWGGPIVHPVKAAKPFRRFPTKKNWAKIQMTPEYKRLLRLGVGLGYSAEEEAYATMSKFRDYINDRNMLGATGKLLELPLRIPLAFQKWQFDTYIPMLKHTANMDEWAALEKRTGKPATDSDLIDIIKATQNFYGEMNERLLGRSATQTTGSRFAFKAPGFAEGNVRTNIDAGTKFVGNRGYTRGRRARAQIVNSLLVKRVIAVAGTLFLTGMWPKRPEKKEDFADLFKIDTGKVDGRGRRIMINTLDSDKDYLDLWFNMFTIRPDRALYKAFNRLGGMKSTLAEFVYDGFTSAMRQDIRDWKGDKVFSLSDTPTEKLWKYTAIALDRLKPISVDVFQQMRYKEISAVQSFLGSLAGVRPTWSEQDKRESEFLRLIYEQKGDLEVLDIEILSKKNPRAAYEHYNKVVDRILDSTYLPEGFKEKYGPELYRDVDKYLENKAFSASQQSSTEEGQGRSKRAVKILKHFEISPNAAEQLLADYYSRTKTKTPYNPIESDRILGRAAKRKRLKERMQTE